MHARQPSLDALAWRRAGDLPPPRAATAHAGKLMAMRALPPGGAQRTRTSQRRRRRPRGLALCARALAGARLRLPAVGLALAAAWLAAAGAAWPRTATVTTATAPPKVIPVYIEESRATFESQLRSGQIKEAEFNKVAQHLHLLLWGGKHMLVAYPGHEEPKLQAMLLAAGVPVTIEYTPVKAKVHHTLRYIAGAALIVVVLALIALLVWRRRRLAAAAQADGAAAGDMPAQR